MNYLKILYFFIFFFLIGCTTIKFGSKNDIILYDDEKKVKNEIKEFDLSYNYKVMGVTVKGEKSVVEGSFLHPDNQTLFIFISFPRLGILKTNNFGDSFTYQFFKLTYFEKVFGYSAESYEESNKQINNTKSIPDRFFCHFAVSPNNPDKVILSCGPYLFLSKDRGDKWDEKNIFYDLENVNIRDVFITNNDEIIVFTDNKIAVSKNWGKSWKKKVLKIDDTPFFKFKYISGLFDNSSNMLYTSIKHNNENDFDLSKKSYEFFYENKESINNSGLYYSSDLGDTWHKTKVNVPVCLWKFNDKIYAGPIYALGFYKYNFDENFKNSKLYKKSNLDTTTQNANKLAKILLESKPEDYQVISEKNNKLILFKGISDIILIDENNFENLYEGIKKVQYLDAIQWKDYWYERKISNNFLYEYNFDRFFKIWTGMRTNSPVLYVKDNKSMKYYRIKPHPDFMKIFIKYSIENQIRLNSIKPFLRKPDDHEFFEPELDPTNGFPVEVEFYDENKKDWKKIVKSDYMARIIDPIGKKRSGFYWYKNVEQKKMLKLQISFGWTEGASYMTYPIDLKVYNNNLLITLSYFSISRSYNDIYLIPLM